MRKIPAKPTETIFGEGKSFKQTRETLLAYLQQGGNAISKSKRMEVLLQLAFCYAITGMLVEAEQALNKCEEYILQHGKPEEVACLYHIRARIHLHYARFEEGLNACMQALHLFRPLAFPYFTQISGIVCGHLCAKLNLFTEAMDYMGEAHTIALQMNNNAEALTCLANLNDIRLHVLSAEDCIQHNKDLLKQIKLEFPDKATAIGMGTCLQLAHLHLKLNKVKHAAVYAKQAYTEFERLQELFPPHFFLFTNLYGIKAEIAARLGNEKEMVKHAEECSSRGRLTNKVVPEADTSLIMFRYYMRTDKPAKAKKLLDHAEAILPPGEASPYYVEVLESKCEYHRAKNNHAEELKHFRLIYDYKMKTHEQALKHRNNYLSLMHDLEVKKKEIETQKSEINSKTLELNMSLYHLEQRNQLLTDIKNELTTLKKTKPKPEVVFKTIFKTINNAFTVEEEKKKHVREKFDETQRSFIAALHQQYPTLSTTECRVCALLRWGFNTKEISSFLSTNTRTIENHRTNIRRKLNLKPGETLGLKLNAIT
jgi:DNA-binding CsgD family transcriptional regulator/tetratricopeptide (TPR) repeat protein